jgi:hypothetical protein
MTIIGSSAAENTTYAAAHRDYAARGIELTHLWHDLLEVPLQACCFWYAHVLPCGYGMPVEGRECDLVKVNQPQLANT